MKPQFIRCEYCKTKISSGSCDLATHSAIINGKEYIFCCAQCAQRYQKKKTK